MRRYGVRFLVAVLTFGIGVALSFALGLFKVPDNEDAHKWSRSPSCRKQFRLQTFTTPNHANAPLKLTYLGLSGSGPGTEHPRMLQVLVENTSDRSISRYVLTVEKRRHGLRVGMEHTSDITLGPGESHLEHILGDVDSDASLGVARVDFQDGSTWTNPRRTR